MNLAVFFAAVRKSLFSGRLKKTQVEGMGRILDYWQENWPAMPIEELAYVLATVKWETGHKFQPIREVGGDSARYAPYYGRGLVQITWRANYAKYGIADDPDKALEWPIALKILFEGMIKGDFTGKKLADYILIDRQDYEGARAIVNGTDKASTIAGYAVKFLAALRAAVKSAPAEEPEPKVSGAVKTGGAVAGGGLITTGGANIANGGDDWMSAISIGAGVISMALPWIIEKFKKPKAPVIETPAPKPPPPDEVLTAPLEITVSPTAGLDAALAHARACRLELENALDDVAEERQKVNERLEALRSAVTAAESETALIKNAVAAPATSPRPAVPATIGE